MNRCVLAMRAAVLSSSLDTLRQSFYIASKSNLSTLEPNLRGVSQKHQPRQKQNQRDNASWLSICIFIFLGVLVDCTVSTSKLSLSALLRGLQMLGAVAALQTTFVCVRSGLCSVESCTQHDEAIPSGITQ
jgi:hypothetical protein